MANSSTSPSTNIIRQNWGKLHDILEGIVRDCFISLVGKLYQDEIIYRKEKYGIVRNSESDRGGVVDNVLEKMERYIDEAEDKEGKTKKLLSIMKREEWLKKRVELMEQGVYTG